MIREMRPALAACGTLVAAMFALSAWAWVRVPNASAVPIHWAANGHPNGYASKPFALLIQPVAAAAVVALLAFLPRIDPRRPNLNRSARAYAAVMIVIVGTAAYAHLITVLSSLGRPIGSLVGGIVVLAALTFVVFGNFMGKIRSNFFFGIRTPWTLSSELSWNRTHRLAGRLFVAVGLLSIVGTLFGLAITILLGGSLIAFAVAVGYSYWVWSRDPERQPASEPVQ